MPRKSRRVDHRISVATRGGPFEGADRGTLARRAHKMLRCLELEPVDVSIALVDDATIAALNRDYRDRDGPTDVLAFAMREGSPIAGKSSDAREQLGDVVISVPTARRQARRQRRPLLDELTMLLAHALLHLIGYDHRTKAEDKVMRARAAELEAAARLPIGRGGGT